MCRRLLVVINDRFCYKKEVIKLVDISPTLVCTKDFSERFVKNLVNENSKLKSITYIEKVGGRVANAKSILGILSLNIKIGDEIKVICNHPDLIQAEADGKKILELIQN